jgi:hypothetical protein
MDVVVEVNVPVPEAKWYSCMDLSLSKSVGGG